MKMNTTPTTIGKWSVALITTYIVLLAVFFTCMFLGFVTFDEGHWWDITVGISVPLVIGAWISGLIALQNRLNRTTLLYVSLSISTITILFLLLHSLFIND